MIYNGKVYEDSGAWLIEVSAFNAMTQGHTREHALDMLIDWFECVADEEGFVAVINDGGDVNFQVEMEDIPPLLQAHKENARSQED